MARGLSARGQAGQGAESCGHDHYYQLRLFSLRGFFVLRLFCPEANLSKIHGIYFSSVKYSWHRWQKTEPIHDKQIDIQIVRYLDDYIDIQIESKSPTLIAQQLLNATLLFFLHILLQQKILALQSIETSLDVFLLKKLIDKQIKFIFV